MVNRCLDLRIFHRYTFGVFPNIPIYKIVHGLDPVDNWLTELFHTLLFERHSAKISVDS